MEKFEFKSAICTSVEQSKRLLKLGLKKETADMWHITTTKDWKGNDIPKEKQKSWISFDGIVLSVGFDQFDRIPAWSLARLMEMVTTKRKVMLVRIGVDLYDTIIEKIRRMIVDGTFNKDYLEEKK